MEARERQEAGVIGKSQGANPGRAPPRLLGVVLCVRAFEAVRPVWDFRAGGARGAALGGRHLNCLECIVCDCS